MIPILYEKTETSFNNEGIGRLSDCISCLVTEERNGVYECEFEYPITGAHYDDIQEGRVIYVTHDESGDPQPFDIYSHTKPINGIVTFYAHHISYRLGEITVEPFTEQSCAAAIAAIPIKSINTNPFTFWTDKSTNGTFNVDVPTACRALLYGEEGSLLDVYGTGEFEFDKFTVKLHLHRGINSGVEIRYGKNLVDLTDEVDYQDTYNAVVPYWFGTKDDDGAEEEILVTLPEWAIHSGYSSYTGRVVLIPMDLSSEWSEQPTEEQLRDKATSLLKSREGWLPSQNVKVDFIALWQTEEYAQYAPLQRVHLCDTVSVYYPELGIEAVEKKVVKVVYNTLLDRYDSIELGELSNTLVGMINSNVEDEMNALRGAINNHDVTFEQIMASAIQNATDLISGGLGGHVLLKPNADGQPEEILIMNTADVNTATKIWRWNLGGLGYSSTGYSGPYGTAITMDGSIVADFITTGTLNANIIRAGVLADINGVTTFNLSTGALNMKKGEINLGSGAFRVTDAGILTMTKGSIDLGNGAFTISNDGSMTIGSNFSVTNSGVITAKSGKIGPFSIYNSSIRYDPPGSQDYVSLQSGNIGIGSYGEADLGTYITSGACYFLHRNVEFSSSKVQLKVNNNSQYVSKLYMTDTTTTITAYGGGRLAVDDDGASITYSPPDAQIISEALFNENCTEISFFDYPGESSIKLYSDDIVIEPYEHIRLLNLETTSNNANIYIDNDGTLYKRTNSSRLHKSHITDSIKDDLNPKRLYDIDVVQYKYRDDYLSKEDIRYKQDLIGFIVEDVEKVYPVCVDKEDPEDSSTWMWNYQYMIPAMLKLIQDQHAEIEELKRRLS